MPDPQTPQPQADWWVALAHHLGVEDKAQRFFHEAQANQVLDHIVEVKGNVHYIMFVLLWHWSRWSYLLLDRSAFRSMIRTPGLNLLLPVACYGVTA